MHKEFEPLGYTWCCRHLINIILDLQKNYKKNKSAGGARKNQGSDSDSGTICPLSPIKSHYILSVDHWHFVQEVSV